MLARKKHRHPASKARNCVTRNATVHERPSIPVGYGGISAASRLASTRHRTSSIMRSPMVRTTTPKASVGLIGRLLSGRGRNGGTQGFGDLFARAPGFLPNMFNHGSFK